MRENFTQWRERLLNSGAIAPLALGASQTDVSALFGAPDDTSVQKKKGRTLIWRYADLEFHFDPQRGHCLNLIYGERDDGSPLVCLP